MAWLSSGTTNEEMVNNMKHFNVIRSDAVEAAFRAVDRQYFAPQNPPNMAHADQPLRDGSVHISAPHIYGCITEALDVIPDSSFSFLNIGSGTGYLSSIVAHIMGPTGVCYGVENNVAVLAHCEAASQRFKLASPSAVVARLAYMEFIHGNGLAIDMTVGEPLLGFDRIYVGAAIERSRLNSIASLLRMGGVLVVPVDDNLIKVTRIGNSIPKSGIVATARRHCLSRPNPLSEDYIEHVVTGVRFAALLSSPTIPTVIRSRIWAPTLHGVYPESFRKSCKEILLCASAPTYQPLPKVANDQINVASQLPRSVWLEIISFTHRDWFAHPANGEDVLRRRLEQEQLAVQRAQESQRETEARLRATERERDGYRLWALRCKAKLEEILRERGEEAEDCLAEDDMSRNHRSDAVFSRVNGFSAIMRQFRETDVDLHAEDDADDQTENASHLDNNDMESDSDDDQSSNMDDVTEADESEEYLISMASSSGIASGVRGRQPRSVSIASYEL